MKVLILGATSAIAQSIANIYSAQGGHEFLLIGRNLERLNSIQSDILIRSESSVSVLKCDLSVAPDMENLIDDCWKSHGKFDLVILAHGSLPDQQAIQDDWDKVEQAFNTNCLSYIALLTAIGKHMIAQKSGTIVVISSVAGDRGRQSNYIYGSAKGAVSIFVQGMRNRMYKNGVHVLTVKPGFVDTPMTKNIEKGGPLWSTPDRVATDVVRAVKHSKNNIYTPWFWKYILIVIKIIPEYIFKRLSL